MGIKRLYQEGSEIMKGKNTWENRGTGWVEQGERSKTEKDKEVSGSCKELWTLSYRWHKKSSYLIPCSGIML